MNVSRVVALVIASASLLGCGKAASSSGAGSSSAAASSLSVKEQCAALDKANEQWSEKLVKRKDTKDAAKDADGMSKDVEAWSTAIGKLPVDDAALKKLVGDEQSVLKEQAATVKDLSTLLAKMDSVKGAPDEKSLDAIQKQMDAVEKKQDASQAASDAIDKKIEDYCADK